MISGALLPHYKPKTENRKKSFCYDGAKLWNSLPADMRDSYAIDACNFYFNVINICTYWSVVNF